MSRSRGYVAREIAPWEGFFPQPAKALSVDNDRDAQQEDELFGHHRGFERFGDTLLVSYSIAEEFAPEFTEAYDIAVGGMAMITNAELLKDSAITVQLELRGDTR